MCIKVKVDKGVDLTRQITGQTNGRKGDLSKTIWKKELVRYKEINRYNILSKDMRLKIRKIK
jgi:hypothetical protein